MESSAKLITAIAALLGALAWPVSILIVVLAFRKEIRIFLEKFPGVLDRMKALKLWAVEAELEKVADKSMGQPENSGQVSIAEVTAAVRIEADVDAVGESILAAQLDKLCTEYQTIRKVMPPSSGRTRAMTRVLVQMRSLGPAVADRIETYKSSVSPGRRLAAVAMMQMRPERVDLEWLARRFREDHPFIFYHAALALQNAANEGDAENIPLVKRAAEEALKTLESFDGEADASSLEVLKSLI